MAENNKCNALVNMETRAICPYNRAHVVPIDRLAYHLVKCKRQHPDVELKICPFNASHHVRLNEFQAHIEVCKSKDIVEKTIYIQRKLDLGKLPDDAVCNTKQTITEDNENWDSDNHKGTYNPKLAALDKSLFRSLPTGLGKSGRRQWRVTEAERITRAMNGTCMKDLMFPTPDGRKVSLEEMSLQNVATIKSTVPNMSQQCLVNKKLMRVDSQPLPSKLNPKCRIAANIFGCNSSQSIVSNGSDENDDLERHKILNGDF